MEIGYNEYPTVLYLSFDQDTAPAELPFEVASEQVRSYLSGCQGFEELFTLIAVKNGMKGGDSNTHFHLTDNLFNKIDDDDQFRNDQFRNFFRNNIKPKNGAILFKNSGQYVYMLLDKQETKIIKKAEGRYIAVALFHKGMFVGFEEGYITDMGINVAQDGHYNGGMNRGGYISFVIITLAYAGDKDHPLKETKFKEKVYELK